MILSLVLIFFLYQAVGGIATFFLMGGMVNEGNVDTARWLTLGGQLLLILVPTLLLARARHCLEPNFFRLRMPNPKEIIATVIGVFALQQVLQGYLMLQDAIPLPGEVARFVEQIKQMIEETYRLLVTSHSTPEFIFVTMVVALVPAVTEELLFRGLVQRNLEGLGGKKAAILAGIIFGAYHLNPFTFIALAALGVYFGYIVYRSGNISLAISAHFFNNFLACAATYMELDEDFVAMSPTGGASPMMVGINSLGFLLVFVLSTVYFVNVTEKKTEEGSGDALK